MNILVFMATLLFGFALGFFLYEVKRYKVGGVIAIPLLVIYTLQDVAILPVFIVSALVCLFVMQAVAEKTLLYGRRLLYGYLGVSILASGAIIELVSFVYALHLEEIIIFTIFPGIIAYNIAKESYTVESGFQSAGMLALNFAAVYLFAVGLSAII